MKLLIAGAVMLMFFALSHIFWRSEVSESEAAENETATDENATPKIVQHISVQEAKELMESGVEFAVLDVRTQSEFEAGSIKGAINIDVQQPDFAERLQALDKTHPVIVHCRSGTRSRRALPELQKLGLPALYHMDGGMRAWQKAGFDVVE